MQARTCAHFLLSCSSPFKPSLIDICVGIDKQPLSPASVGVSGGNQEFKDASEEHDDSVTVADTQEEN